MGKNRGKLQGYGEKVLMRSESCDCGIRHHVSRSWALQRCKDGELWGFGFQAACIPGRPALHIVSIWHVNLEFDHQSLHIIALVLVAHLYCNHPPVYIGLNIDLSLQ